MKNKGVYPADFTRTVPVVQMITLVTKTVTKKSTKKLHCLFLLIGASIALAACGTPSESQKAAASEQRKVALQRWYECLNDQMALTPVDDQQSARASRRTCQGYEFDILATYPPHMEPSLNHLLAQSAQRVLQEQNPHSATLQNLPELARSRPVNNRWKKTLKGDSLPKLD